MSISAPGLRPFLAFALLVVAGYLVFRQLARPEPGEKGFFYDASARRIFLGPRDGLPPIRGIDGPEEDGFRALVVSTNGRPADRASWQVAYLEKMDPSLKREMSEARKDSRTLPMGQLGAKSLRFVRKLDETRWHPMTSDDGDAIVSGWARPGPDGIVPVICVP